MAVVVLYFAAPLAVIRAEQVAQDGEQPGRHVGTGLELIEMRERPQQRFLNEVVRFVHVAAKRNRKGAEPRHGTEHCLAHRLIDLLPRGRYICGPRHPPGLHTRIALRQLRAALVLGRNLLARGRGRDGSAVLLTITHQRIPTTSLAFNFLRGCSDSHRRLRRGDAGNGAVACRTRASAEIEPRNSLRRSRRNSDWAARCSCANAKAPNWFRNQPRTVRAQPRSSGDV